MINNHFKQLLLVNLQLVQLVVLEENASLDKFVN
jgi:hypothetical protein